MADLTKNAITESFIRLISEKPFDKITVKDIVEDCDITRRTFYYHFTDMYDLVETLFRTETERIIEENISENSWQEGFLSASRFIIENKQAVLHLYNSLHREELKRYVGKIAQEVMSKYINDISKDMNVGEDDKELIGDFYRYALMGIVDQWLDTGMKTDAEANIRRLGVLFDDNIKRSLETAMKQK